MTDTRAQRGTWDVAQPVDALYRRLDALEQQRQALATGARGAERATLWLGPEDRATALRRLREITSPVGLQLDAFAQLRDSLDDAA
jgi:hypothetical protein